MSIPIGLGATGAAVAENRVITASEDPKTMFPDCEVNDLFFGRTGYRSMIVAPVSGESGALGALAVYSQRPNAFDDDDAGVIRSLAAQAAIAITNARLIEELDRSRREVERRAEAEHSLRDIAARITSLRDPDELLARVVEESRRLLRSDGAHLTRMSDDRTYLVPVIVAGGMDANTERWLKTMQFPLGGGINGLAAAEVRPIWTADYAADPRIPHEPDDELAAERLGLRAMAAAPLRAPGGEVVGTLAVSYRQPREIVADELGLLQGLADQAAIALANAKLYELLGESEARYRNLVQNSPDLVWSIDADARFTFVSDTTSRRLTGWRADELLGRHFGALVHESSRDVAEIDWTANLGDDDGTGGRELRGRVNLLHRDGHPIPTEFIAFARRDERHHRARAPRARPPPPGWRACVQPGAGPSRPRAARLGDPGAVQHDPRHSKHGAPRRSRPGGGPREADRAPRPPARGAGRDAGPDLRAAAREPRARRAADRPADPFGGAPGPDRPPDRRHERPDGAAAARDRGGPLPDRPGGAPQCRQARGGTPGRAGRRPPRRVGCPPGPRRRQGLRRGNRPGRSSRAGRDAGASREDRFPVRGGRPARAGDHDRGDGPARDARPGRGGAPSASRAGRRLDPRLAGMTSA